MQAGLLPRYQSAWGEWQILPILRRAAAACRAGVADPQPGSPRGSTLSAGAANEHAAGRRLLVVDQLEELVTLASAATDRQAFLQQILDAVSASGGGLHVVFTPRSDQ